jgi:hypothetical protein
MCTWAVTAAALGPLAPMSRSRVRGAALALAGFAHLALGSAPEARELGVLHGTMQPKLVALLQAISDRDGDGYSAALGGGDCDDADPAIYPSRCEVAGNGIDDNCNGATDPPARPGRRVARTPRADRPDVYFVLLDSVRADFGSPDDAAARWQSLSALARESLDFQRAYAPYPSTYRALMATFQSRSVRQLDAGALDLFALATRAGYDAQLWIAARRLRLSERGARGFAQRGPDNPFSVTPEGKAGWTAALIDDVIAELAPGAEAAPRLRWLHLLDAHKPWVHARAGDERQRYLQELAHLELHVTRLLDALAHDERGRRAVIVVLADHGEQLGEHGAHFHDAFLWEESIRVPLIMRLPGAPARTIAAPASLLDIAPTLAAYLGFDAPESFQGHDWLTGPVQRPQPPVAEVSGMDTFGGVGRPARHAVLGPRYKLMLNVSENLLEVYDLTRDPYEERPLHAGSTSAAAPLRAFLSHWQDAPGCSER